MSKPNKFDKKGKPIFKAKARSTGGTKTRKDLRKEKRVAKKQRQQQHVLNKCGKGKSNTEESASTAPAITTPTKVEINDSKFNSIDQIFNLGKGKGKKGSNKKSGESKEGPPQNLNIVKQRLEKEMQKERKKQLQMANKDEDKNIKQLAKQLRMNRRKSKSMPKAFATEGLDCILFKIK